LLRLAVRGRAGKRGDGERDGATGPDANQYYAMGAPDFRRT